MHFNFRDSTLIASTLVVICLAAARANRAGLAVGFDKIEVGTGSTAITVYTYKPKTYVDGPLVVVFHGMKRNAEGYCSYAAALADRRNVLIAAPLFDKAHFPGDDYHMGGVIKKGVEQPREKWTYQRVAQIIEAVREREGHPKLPYYFIGHSAGAQFVMRYAALMPAGPERIVAANPGSDLFPRRDWPFGYGFGGLPNDISDDAVLQRYLAVRLTIYLGLDDTDPQHPELDRTPAAEKEGAFRLERGRACFAFGQALAREHGWAFNWRKIEVPGIAHDAKPMLGAREAEQALFGPGGKTDGK